MGDVLTLLLLALPLAFIYFFMVRPTQRRTRAAQELSDSLTVGQQVMTTSGLYGVVAGIDDDRVRLAVADGVTLEFSRRAVAAVVPLTPSEASGPE